MISGWAALALALSALVGLACAAPREVTLEGIAERLSAVEREHAERLSAVEKENVELRERVRLLETGRRKLQRTAAGGSQPREVHIYTRELVRGGAGAPAGPGRGHRRAQAATCDLDVRLVEVAAECCDQPGESCANGAPETCNADCARVVLPFWEDCADSLDKPTRSSVHHVLQECQEALVRGEGESLAMQLRLSCPGGEATEDCVPACDEELHGDLLLANIDGEDSKYSCELHHSKYSWMGSAADGGYLGRVSTTNTRVPGLVSSSNLMSVVVARRTYWRSSRPCSALQQVSTWSSWTKTPTSTQT